MASVIIFDRNDHHIIADIYYSIVDGNIHTFELEGKMLYSERGGINESNWREILKDVVRKQGLNRNSGRGFSAFVRPLMGDEMYDDPAPSKKQ